MVAPALAGAILLVGLLGWGWNIWCERRDGEEREGSEGYCGEEGREEERAERGSFETVEGFGGEGQKEKGWRWRWRVECGLTI